MAEIVSTYDSYDEYLAINGKYVPTSTVTLAEDIMFEDGTNLIEKIESLKQYGIEVKKMIASAISMIGKFTESEASWETIINNLKYSFPNVAKIELFRACGDNYIYTIPTAGTYQIDCACYGEANGTLGNYCSCRRFFDTGEVLVIFIGDSSTPIIEISYTESQYELVNVHQDMVNVAPNMELTNTKIRNNVNAIDGYVRIYNVDKWGVLYE